MLISLDTLIDVLIVAKKVCNCLLTDTVSEMIALSIFFQGWWDRQVLVQVCLTTVGTSYSVRDYRWKMHSMSS